MGEKEEIRAAGKNCRCCEEGQKAAEDLDILPPNLTFVVAYALQSTDTSSLDVSPAKSRHEDVPLLEQGFSSQPPLLDNANAATD